MLSTAGTWAAENFYRTELLTGRWGRRLLSSDLSAASCCKAIFAGALANLSGVLTFSAYFHTIRIFGGTAGAIYMVHSSLKGKSCTQTSWDSTSAGAAGSTYQNIHAMSAGLYAKSFGMAAAGTRAIDLIAARLRLQALQLER